MNEEAEYEKLVLLIRLVCREEMILKRVEGAEKTVCELSEIQATLKELKKEFLNGR